MVRNGFGATANLEPILVVLILFSMAHMTHVSQWSEAWHFGLLLLALTGVVAISRARASAAQPSAEPRRAAWRSLPAWEDGLLLVTALGMTVSTLVSNDPQPFPLAIWLSGIFLSIYAHRRFRGGFIKGSGRGFGFGSLLLAGASIVAVNLGVSFFQLMSSDPRVTEMVGGGGVRMTRAVGLFWTANILGSWLVLFLPLLVISGFQRYRERRLAPAVAYVALALGSLFLLLRNLSRLSVIAGLLVAILSLLVVGMRRLPHRHRTRLAVAIVLMVLASGALVLWLARADTQTDHRYTRIVQAKIRDSHDTIRFRLSLQKQALDHLPQHIGLGLGYGRNTQVMPSVGAVADALSPRLKQRYRAARDHTYAPHHLGLMLALDAGLMSCLCFFAAVALSFARFLRRGLQWSLETHALAISVVAWLFLGLGYNIIYGQEVWPLGLLLFGAFRGALGVEGVGSVRAISSE